MVIKINIVKKVESTEKSKTLRETIKTLEKTMRCNCDLDNWEPERDTGHSWVCRIHKAAKQQY